MREYSYYDEAPAKELSPTIYNAAIGLILLWGFVINAIMCINFTDVFMSWNPTAIVIGYFAVAIGGIVLSTKSDNPFLSFIGYNMVVLPVGVVLSLYIDQYETYSIVNTLFATAGVTFVMIILAVLKPNVFLSMGQMLFFALLSVVIIELVMIFIGYSMPTVWDWLVALLFTFYIAYDWAKAQTERKTLDNAVDACVGLYLDIINLFIRILGASGSKKSSRK